MNRIRMRLVIVVLALAATAATAATATVWASTGHGGSNKSIDATTSASLCKEARQVAALNGEPSPSAIEAVTATRDDAVHVAQGEGEDVLSHEDVYLVQMQGAFTGYEASVPAGTELPKGGVMTFTISVSSGAVLDWGIASAAANLSVLGPVGRPCEGSPANYAPLGRGSVRRSQCRQQAACMPRCARLRWPWSPCARCPRCGYEPGFPSTCTSSARVTPPLMAVGRLQRRKQAEACPAQSGSAPPTPS